jgi:hypothetical protein
MSGLRREGRPYGACRQRARDSPFSDVHFDPFADPPLRAHRPESPPHFLKRGHARRCSLLHRAGDAALFGEEAPFDFVLGASRRRPLGTTRRLVRGGEPFVPGFGHGGPGLGQSRHDLRPCSKAPQEAAKLRVNMAVTKQAERAAG